MNVDATDALIVVDVQNDFCPGGALAVSDGDAVIEPLNGLMSRFEHIVLTRDWHPPDHCSFANEPRFEDMSWPIHCVAETTGAAFHADLTQPPGHLLVSKGTDRELEAYSGFQGTTLKDDLRARGVKRLFVGGLATDYCVKHTVLDGLKAGFDVYVLEDACRGVDLPPGTASVALHEMARAGAKRCQSSDLSP